jgi:hypothetical protein
MSECRKRAAILVADVVGYSLARRGGRGAHARAAAPAAQNDGYGADSGPSRGDPGGRAIRPIEPFAVVTCYVRSTSTPAVDLHSLLRLLE